MKTTHSTQDVKQHQPIIRLICHLHPHLFHDKFPHPCHPNPLSTADRIHKSQVPRLAPSYNPHAYVLPPAVTEASRAMVFALVTDSTFSESHQLTSDDVIVLLNSGTSCAVSNNTLDFEYIQPVQDLELKGIISGLKVEGIGQALFNQLKSLVTEFHTEQTNMAEPLSEQSVSAIDFSALHNIINQQNRIHDGLSFEGIFNLRDPHAFAAGSQTNPNILTQSQMFKAADHKDFIESQVSEIDSLIEAGVFKYMQMNELPPDACLLNTIWSYRRKH